MRASTALALLLASSVGSAAAAAPKPPPCPGGRFVVQGGALLANPISFADDVYFSATQIAVASGCTGAPVKLKGSKRGTTVKATWETCNGVTGKVKLKAKVDPTCQTLTGTLSAKKQRPKLKRKFTATLVASQVRECDYLPGVSQPATMPPEVTDPPDPPPPPPPDPPGPTAVSPETTAAQLDVFDGLWNAVNDEYVDPGFNGVDWGAVGDGYEQLVEAGLSDEDFAKAMALMVGELGDGHSYYQSPQVVADEEAAMAAGLSFVGIGVLALPLPDQTGGSLIVVFPGSPADEAGLRVHDLMLMVDGGPVRDEFGISRTRGPAGTSFMLTYSRGSGAPQTIQLTREAVSGFLPIDSCIVPGTRIGYVLLPTFLSPPVPEQVRRALQDMTLEGPLAGLVVDNRMNGGGLGSVTAATLGFFTAGVQGRYVGRSGERPLEIVPEDVGGSQSVPLVVMTDRDTVSNGEIFSGVLQVAGRATIVGGPSAGNVETLHEFDFPDASRAWLAAETFAPNGMAPGAWEGVGILPDAEVRTRWDLFTEETDPALAAAVELLLP
jgi:carboxyl-terminal processing protease